MPFGSHSSDQCEVRSVPRTGLFLAAVLHSSAGAQPVRIRNLSASGALIEGFSPLALGEAVRLERASNSSSAVVRWSNAERAGLEFDDPILMDAWVPSALAQQQSAFERRVHAVRNGLRIPDDFADQKPVLNARISCEIELAKRTLAACLDELSNSSLLITRHPRAFQDIEITCQVLGHLAQILSSDDPASAIAGIGMDELKRRLTRS